MLSGRGIPGIALAFKERWAAWKKSGLIPECNQISCGVYPRGDAASTLAASFTTGPLSELPAEQHTWTIRSMPVGTSSFIASSISFHLSVFSYPLLKIRYIYELMEPLESL